MAALIHQRKYHQSSPSICLSICISHVQIWRWALCHGQVAFFRFQKLFTLFTMVIPYSRGGTVNQKPFKIKSCQARFLNFSVNVVQYNQISQFGVSACTDFGQTGIILRWSKIGYEGHERRKDNDRGRARAPWNSSSFDISFKGLKTSK